MIEPARPALPRMGPPDPRCRFSPLGCSPPPSSPQRHFSHPTCYSLRSDSPLPPPTLLFSSCVSDGVVELYECGECGCLSSSLARLSPFRLARPDLCPSCDATALQIRRKLGTSPSPSKLARPVGRVWMRVSLPRSAPGQRSSS
jgi:hypothetical protein